MLVVRTASDIDIVKHQHLQNRTSKRRKRKERVLSMFTSLSISDAIRSAYTKTRRRKEKKKNVLPYVNAEVSDARGAVKKHNGTLFRTQGFRLVTLGAGNNAKATAWG